MFWVQCTWKWYKLSWVTLQRTLGSFSLSFQKKAWQGWFQLTLTIKYNLWRIFTDEVPTWTLVYVILSHYRRYLSCIEAWHSLPYQHSSSCEEWRQGTDSRLCSNSYALGLEGLACPLWHLPLAGPERVNMTVSYSSFGLWWQPDPAYYMCTHEILVIQQVNYFLRDNIILSFDQAIRFQFPVETI